MSLSAKTFQDVISEIIASPYGDKLAAIHAVQRQFALWQAERNNLAWADGCRGDAVAKIPGLTDTLTSLVRRFAACGVVRYADVADLHRHVSALRKRLKDLAPSVVIETIIGEGYEVVAGFDHLYRLLHAGKQTALRIPGFTVKQTAILTYMAHRGAAHVDQFKCLQRHMSNIRAELKRQGLSKKIVIATHGGEGLYTVENGRDLLAKLLAGEAVTPEPKPKAQPKPRRAAARAQPQLVVMAA